MKYFFSYSRNDSDFAFKLATDLKIENLNVWLDQLDILPGSRWDDAVEKALNEAECILVVLSASSVKSENVLDEVSYAIKKGRDIIPLLVDNCEVPFRIARFQLIDFINKYETGLHRLIETLNEKNRTNNKSPEPIDRRNNDNKASSKRRLSKNIINVSIVAILIIAVWYMLSTTFKRRDNYSKEKTILDSIANIRILDQSSQTSKNSSQATDLENKYDSKVEFTDTSAFNTKSSTKKESRNNLNQSLYKGNIGKLSAIFKLTFYYDEGKINGTYFYPTRKGITYKLSGVIHQNQIELSEFTDNNLTANCILVKNGDNCYVGKMYNTDGRKFDMTFCIMDY